MFLCNGLLFKMVIKKKLKHPCEVYLINIAKILWNAIEHKNLIESRLGPRTQEEYHKAWTQPSPYIKNKFIRYLDEHARKVNSKNLKKINIRKIHYNNSLVSYVTALEVFLRDFFVILINEDKKIKHRFLSGTRKINLQVLEDYKKGNITLGEIIAREYNFQNLDSIQSAYKELGLDFYKLLMDHGKVRFRTKRVNRIELLKGLLDVRHKIIHDGKFYKNIIYEDIGDLWVIFYSFCFDIILYWILKKKIKSQSPK